MDETKETLNEGGDKKVIPSSIGQPDKDDSKKPDDDSKEKVSNETILDKTPEDKDTVEVSKTELAKLKSDLENYKKGLISLKKKSFKLPIPAKKEAKEDESLWNDEDLSQKYVTKEEYHSGIEKTAIEKSLADESMPELSSNWDDIMSYYANRHGDTTDGYVHNIKDAYYLWKRDNTSPVKEKPISAKKDVSKLTQETKISKGKDVKNTPPKKSILPKPKPMKEWY